MMYWKRGLFAPVGFSIAAFVAALGLLGCDTPSSGSTVAVAGESCASCHLGAYERAAFGHAGVGYGSACATCHTKDDWTASPPQVQHDSYPLMGAHGRLSCAGCHVPRAPDPLPRDCVGCHAGNRDAAETDHGGFPDDCRGCHNQEAWRPASYGGHDAWYPLEGRHAEIACALCHVDGRFAGTPRTCVGCHASRRDEAEQDHAGFPDDCGVCHNQVAWSPALFDDHARVFPLVGRHAHLACGDCHVNGVWAGTPRTCIGCHRAARDRASPSHAGFPDACTDCHGQDAWRPATFRHRRFRVPHRGVRDCVDCHPDPADFGNFTCTDCHAHRRASMDGEHRGVRNYRYESRACYGCHSRGTEDD